MRKSTKKKIKKKLASLISHCYKYMVIMILYITKQCEMHV